MLTNLWKNNLIHLWFIEIFILVGDCKFACNSFSAFLVWNFRINILMNIRKNKSLSALVGLYMYYQTIEGLRAFSIFPVFFCFFFWICLFLAFLFYLRDRRSVCLVRRNIRVYMLYKKDKSLKMLGWKKYVI